eukprot:CAMPEP_0118913006 /NCGR_PEP_ID=MMETSP1166-20130328/14002_1 /TAXON_ID=1104430 /ORGANISM="Chrysoreinhardia sp, Strain CCMP3193" /LENGTH=376 /DNA_ID=CAMNT_0006852539 /DNA_START=59 /DNA_END=1187 /DNA_ORIENTATION=+
MWRSRSSSSSSSSGGSSEGSVEYDGRTVKYATSAETGDLAVVFLPLGVSRSFVAREELATSARKVGLRLVAVDRPGIGGTSPEGPTTKTREDDDATERKKTARRSRTVERRLRTHSEDVATVLRALGGSSRRPPRVIGVCAGTPYALHFATTTTTGKTTQSSVFRGGVAHLTLVTPWVQPYDCEHAWPLARVASQRWFLGRSFAGYVLANVQLGIAMPALRSLEPAELLGLLDTKLTARERTELQAARARQAADLRRDDDDDDDGPTGDGPGPGGGEKKNKKYNQESGDGSDLDDDDDDDVLDLERRVEAALGSRALNHIAENAKAHNVKAFTADVRVCLSSFDEVLAGQHLADLPLEGATLFAGDDDHLVNPAAV